MNRQTYAGIVTLVLICGACAADKVLSPGVLAPTTTSKVYAPDEEPPTSPCQDGSAGCPWEIQTVYIVASQPARILYIYVAPISAAPTWGVSDPSTGPSSPNGGVNPLDPNCAPGTEPVADFPIPEQPTDEVCPREEGTVCIDLWIRDTIIASTLKGDARDANPDATPRMSRAQIIIPTDNPNASRFTVSPTCAVLMGRTQCYQPLSTGTGGNNVGVSVDPAGSFTVSFTLRNSWMQIPGVRIGIGPAIDGMLTFYRQGDGSYSLGIDNSRYPSMAVYSFKNGVWDKLVETMEQNPLYLIDWLSNIAPVNSGATCTQR